MKSLPAIFISACLIPAISAGEEEQALADDTAKINYSVGYQIGSDFQYQETEVRSEALLKGIRDGMSDGEALMTQTEMRKTMAELGKKVADQKRERKMAAWQKLLDESREFHASNAEKPGVTTTSSGLQYQVIKQGEGESPNLTDRVLVHYRGKLLDGSQFDSSYDRGEPTSFRVDQVITGWTEALQLMKPGAHWELYIPPALAYGEKGAPPNIPPHSSLIFDVELISIEKSALTSFPEQAR